MQLNWISILLVGIGGGLGSVARYFVYLLEKEYWKSTSGFPYATLGVNLLGSFVIGCFLSKILSHHTQHSALLSFIVVGVLGGFTTFSSFSADNLRLINEGKILLAFIYISSSVLLGLLLTYCGYLIFKN